MAWTSILLNVALTLLKRVAVAVVALATSFSASVRAQESASTDWTGPYLGLNGAVRLVHTPAGVFGTKAAKSGGLAVFGVQFGQDWQLGPWVLGFEGDFDEADQSRNWQGGHLSSDTCVDLVHNGLIRLVAFEVCSFATITETRHSEVDSDASFRFRGGYSFGRYLLYGTGGIALAGVSARKQDIVFDPQFGAISHCGPSDPSCTLTGGNQKLRVGWSIGLGSEVQLTSNFSTAFEYRHADFGAESSPFTFANDVYSGNGRYFLSPNPMDARMPNKSRTTNDTISIRLNYRFRP